MAKPARTPASRPTLLTAYTYNRRRVFDISRLADRFIETLHILRSHGHFRLHAFLVLPDHIHLVLTPNVLALGDTVRLIQSSFAKHLNTPHSIWHPGFTAHPILSIRHLEEVRAYLHREPVRAKLVTTAELYPYSSAHRIALPIAPRYSKPCATL